MANTSKAKSLIPPLSNPFLRLVSLKRYHARLPRNSHLLMSLSFARLACKIRGFLPKRWLHIFLRQMPPNIRTTNKTTLNTGRISKTAIRRYVGIANLGFGTVFESPATLPKQTICGG